MKISRLFSFALIALTFGTAAPAQESAEVASLRAKAERGNGIAQYNLGLAYLEGRGTASDPLQAYVWLSLARENGARGRALDSLVGTFDRTTLETAQQKLATFKAAIGSATLVRAEPAPTPVETPAAATEAPVGPAAESTAPRPPSGPGSPGPTVPAPARPASADDPALPRLRAERDALANRLNELTAQAAALRADRQRLAETAAGHEKSAAATTASNQILQEQVRTAEERGAALARDAVTAREELADVRKTLTALQQTPRTAPDNSALDAKTRELQTTLAELETSRSFGRQVEETLNRVTDQKAALEARLKTAQAELAAKSSAPSYPDQSGRVRELEAQLVAARQPVAPAYPDLREWSASLEAQVTKQADEAVRIHEQIVALTQAKVTAESALAAKPNAPVYPDLSARVRELETQLVAAQKPVAPAYPDVRSKVTALESQVASLGSDLSAAAAAKADGQKQIAALTQARSAAESALAAARHAAPAYPDLSAQVRDLESQLATAQRRGDDTATKLSGRVRELETQVAGATGSAEQARTELAALASAKAQAEQALAVARNAKPAYADLSGRVAELESKLAGTEKALAAKPTGPTYPDLSGRVKQLEATVADTNRQLVAAQNARPAAPAYPDLSAQVRDLESQLATAQRRGDDTATRLSGRVHELETQVAGATGSAEQARTEMAALAAAKVQAEQALAVARNAKPAYADLSGRVAELESKLAGTEKALAAKPAGPAYPDLSDRVKQLEATVADTNRQLVAAQNARPAAPAYPDLSGRVAELETAAAAAREESAQKVTGAEQARTELAKQFDAYKSATIVAQRESTTLQASLKMLESDKAALRRQTETATTEAAQLRTQVAQLKTAAAAIRPAAPTYPDLSGQVTELERRLAAQDAANQATQNELQATVSKLIQERSGLVAAAETARQATPAWPDLRSNVARLEARLTELTADLTTATSAQADAQRQITSLSLAKNAAETALAAKPTAPIYPDLSGQVASLEASLATANKNAEAATATNRQSAADLDAAGRQIAQLKSTLASQPAAPTYPDLSDRVKTLEATVADTNRQLVARTDELSATAAGATDARQQIAALTLAKTAAEQALASKPSAPAYPDLSEKVGALESTVSTLTNELGQAKQSRTELSKQFDAYKSATVASQRESTTLQASVKMLESDKAALRRQAETATTEAVQLRTQVAQLKTAAAAIKPTAPAYPDLSAKVAELESSLTAARNSAPAYPDLSGKVTALENQIAVLNARPTAPSYPDLSGNVRELETKLAAAEKAVAARPAAPAYPDLRGQVADLQASLAAKPAAPSYPDLSSRVGELESQLARANTDLSAAGSAKVDLSGRVTELESKLAAAQQSAAAQPAAPVYPDLSDKVRQLESALSDSSRQVVAADTALGQLQQQLTEARGKGEESIQFRRERDELSGRVTSLAGELASLRSDRERMQKMLADAGKQLRESAADAARIKELEEQTLAAGRQIEAANLQIAQLRTAVAEQPAAPTYPDLSDRVRELETKLASADQAAAARPGAPAYPDLRGQVADLQARLAAKPVAPAHPDLSGNVQALENQIAVLTTEAGRSRQEIAALTRARDAAATGTQAAPAYPDLSGRVTELESTLAATQRSLTDTQAALSAEQAKPATVAMTPTDAPADLSAELAAAKAEATVSAQGKAEAEDKLATALRGYTSLERERDNDSTRANQAAANVSAENNSLAARLAAVENRVSAAETEAVRANEALGALQRSSAQAINDLAATRALAQQLQGSNTVLASENYQLKTMLSRSVGTAATAAAPPAAVTTVPAVRTHVIAGGDSLTRISQRYYGSANRWPEIYNANRDKIGTDGILRVGVVLRIP